MGDAGASDAGELDRRGVQQHVLHAGNSGQDHDLKGFNLQ
jgi:hypothetical protein